VPLPPPTAPAERIVGAAAVSAAAFTDSSNARSHAEVEREDRVSQEKLLVDFSGDQGLCERVDDDIELVNLLCTRVAAMMEDASVIALTLGALQPDARAEAMAHLEHASEQIHALIHAALAIES